MKRLPILLVATILIGSLFSSCNQNDNDDDPLPDAVFNATVTGAVNQVISFTLPENVAGTEAVNGSFTSANDMFAMSAMNLAGAWQLGLFYGNNTWQIGTYDLTGTSGFTNPSQSQSGFLATSGSITISKSELFQGVGSGVGAADDYFIDGSFTATMESSDTPPQQIQISGTFTGINIKVN